MPEKRLKLFQAQKEQIIQVMTEVAARCARDGDAMVDIHGFEVATLLKAFGNGKLEESKRYMLVSDNPVFSTRAGFFIESTNPKVLIKNAKEVYNQVLVALQTRQRRQDFLGNQAINQY